jgi:hypothetical protein
MEVKEVKDKAAICVHCSIELFIYATPKFMELSDVESMKH